MSRSYLFSSESVSPGHPDKVADQVADAVLDAALGRDPSSHVACEVLLTRGMAILAGEFKTAFPIQDLRAETPALVASTLERIGYGDPRWGFAPSQFTLTAQFDAQSTEIDRGVTQAEGEIGAGDQGLMFGYATDETPERMPLAIVLARRLMAGHVEARRGDLPWLGPDAKSQVTVRYENGRPAAVETVVVSTLHRDDVPAARVEEAVREVLVDPVVPAAMRAGGFRVLINPAGPWNVGGPMADTGLTGRKIIADTYGGSCPHGGGAFSGKDPTKVDRSGALIARYIAKNVVAAGLAARCTVQLAYAIGRPEPVSLLVDCHGTATADESAIERAAGRVFPLTPRRIIEALALTRPVWARAAAFGPFAGALPGFTWEAEDRVEALREAVGG